MLKQQEKVKETQKKFYNKKQKPIIFQVKQKIILLVKNLQQQKFNKKLSD